MAIADPVQAVATAYSWFTIRKRRTSRTWHECICSGCRPAPLSEEEQELLLDLIERSWKANPTKDFLRVADSLNSWSVYHDDIKPEHLSPFARTALTSLEALHQYPEGGYRFDYSPVQTFLQHDHLWAEFLGRLREGTAEVANIVDPPKPLGATLAKVWSRLIDTGELMKQRGEAWYQQLPVAEVIKLLRDTERCFSQEHGREVTNQQGYKEVLEVNT